MIWLSPARKVTLVPSSPVRTFTPEWIWTYSHSVKSTRHLPGVDCHIPQNSPSTSSRFHVVCTGSPETTLAASGRSTTGTTLSRITRARYDISLPPAFAPTIIGNHPPVNPSPWPQRSKSHLAKGCSRQYNPPNTLGEHGC
jgi:hypothetical protein